MRHQAVPYSTNNGRPSRKQFQGPPQFEKRNIMGCYICGGQHRARDCPQKIKNQGAVVTTFIASTQTFDDRQGALCEVCDKVPFDPKCIVTVQGVNTMAIRDTGATTTVVSKCLVPKACFTGKTQTVTLASKDAKGELPTAIVVMDTPYFHGKTEVLVMDDPVVPVLIGNTRKHDKTLEAVPVYPRANTAAAVQSKPDQNKVETLSVKYTPLGKITPKELKEEKSKDPSLSKCMVVARKRDLGMQRTNGVSSRYVLKKGILKRIVKSGGKEEHQVVMPKPFRKAVLRVAHDIPMSGHLAAANTKRRLLSAFYWLGLDSDVRNYCLSCDACQRCANKGVIKRAPLQRVPLISTPFKRVAVDIVGPLNPPSEKGNRYILTMVDYATKYPEAIAHANTDSATVTDALLDMWSCLGIPEEVVSDKGTQFTSQLMKEVHQLLHIR
ncbi:hypothetical protein ACOMHN_053722 [Nucella lapillus]